MVFYLIIKFMLKSLSIKNFAIIENVEVNFSEGFNVITGETGSGKSILIDALLLLLGERASLDIIRQPANKAILEAIFEMENNLQIKEIFEENEIDFAEEIIIRREISAKGSRNFINDCSVSLNILKSIGNLLIDFHGQHDNQILLNSSQHIEILDLFGDYNKIIANYKQGYAELSATISQLQNLIKKEKDLKQNLKFLKLQFDEINKVNPFENEDEIIENELNIIENSELLHNLTDEIYENLYNSDSSVFNALANIYKPLNQLNEIDPSFANYLEELNSAITIVREIASFSKTYNDKIDFSPEKIEELRTRIFALNSLKKKYGTLDEIIKLKEKLSIELNSIENFDYEIEQLHKKINTQKNDLKIIAVELSELRKNKAKELSDEIKKHLMNLGINYPNFYANFSLKETGDNSLKQIEINNQKTEFGNDGIDNVEFYFSANQGESPKQLSLVASGGEISRLMLTLKTILADKTDFPTLIFDEIDTGISGRIAQKTGIAMKNLATNYQIIAITHLPQIAALANWNIVVNKIEQDGKTFANAKSLSQDEKLIEIAKMLSGELISDNAIESAKELINFI